MFIIILLSILLLICGFAIKSGIDLEDSFMIIIYGLLAVGSIIILCAQHTMPSTVELSSKKYILKKQINILDNQIDTTYILIYDHKN